jgi:integrase/recombinase XerC
MRSERNSSPNTIRAYRHDMDEFSRFLKGRSISNLSDFRRSRLLVREFWMELSKRKIRTATLLRKLASLRSFFKFLVREDVLETNPFNYLRVPRKEKSLPRFLTEREMDDFISTLERFRHPLAARDRALVEVLYSSGLRVQEAADLNLEDLDLWNGTARVFGKGSRERLVPVGGSAVGALEKYLDERKNLRGSGDVLRGAVFLNAREKRITARGVRVILDRWVRRSALRKSVSPHMFRHSFATHLLNTGCDLRTVQEMLGHRSLTSTQVDAHTSTDRLKKVYESAHPRA